MAPRAQKPRTRPQTTPQTRPQTRPQTTPQARPQTIARAARAAGVNVETIRYYERIGLIERPPTVGTAVRIYPDETVRRIRFVKRAQKLGFTLKEIRELLRLRAGSGGAGAAVRRRAEAKITEIEQRVKDLRALRRALLNLLERCPGRGGAEACPILKSLEEET